MMRRLLCALTAACLGPAPALAQGFETTELVRSGDEAPGTGGLSYAPVRIGFSDASGRVVFESGLDGTPGAGLFEIRDGVTSPIVLEGDTAPGGETITSLEIWNPDTPSGPLAYEVELTPGVFAVLRDDEGVVTEVVRSGDPAPGTGGATFDGFVAPMANASGTIVFNAFLDPSGSGIFRVVGGTVTPVALSGETAPGTGGEPFDGFGFATSNDAGDVAFTAFVLVDSQLKEGVFAASGGVLRKVMLEGDPAPLSGGETYTDVFPGPQSIDAQGAVYFTADLGSSAYGIFAESGGVTQPVVVDLDPAPRFGGAFRLPRLRHVNGRGDLAFTAVIGDEDDSVVATGLFVKSGSEIQSIVLDDPVTGPGLSVVNARLDDRRELVWNGSLAGIGGLFLSRPATVPALPGAWLPGLAIALLAAGATAVRRSRRP